MKKQILIFILVPIIFGLVPFSPVNAITQNQISTQVQIVCPDNYGNWFSGSGTIINSKGIILTNKHVVTDQYGGIIKACFIGFIEKANQEPNFGTEASPYFAVVKYTTTSNDMDAAILYMQNTNGKTFSYINIWDSNSDLLQLGEKIEVIGYPSIGGSTITYTSGVFSGYGSRTDGTLNFIKTTASLEHGSSGGAAYNSKGQYIGIPTMVISGQLNSLGYILSVNSIKNWLSTILGSDFKNDVIIQRPKALQPEVQLNNDITPPNLEGFRFGFNNIDAAGGIIGRYITSGKRRPTKIIQWDNPQFYWYEGCNYKECIGDNSGTISGYYYYFGKDPKANPRINGKYVSSENMSKTYYNDMFQEWYPWIQNPNYQEDYGSGYKVAMPQPLKINKEGIYYFILQAVDGSNNISGNLINYQYVYEKDNFREIKKIEVYNENKKKIGEFAYTPELLKDAGGGFDLRFEVFTKYKKLYLKPIYPFKTNGVIALITHKLTCSMGELPCSKGKLYKDNLVSWDSSQGNIIFVKPAAPNRSKMFAVSHLVVKFIYDPKKKALEKGKYSGMNVTLIK